MVTTLNDQLDYFGTVVNVATRLPRTVGPGELAITPAVAADERVAAVLAPVCDAPEVVPVDLPGLEQGFVHRVAVPASGPGA
jgi:hypothetical protein